MLRALHHAGFGHVDEGAVKSACQAFDPDRTNGLSLDQYIAMTLFLLAAKRAFDAFRGDERDAGRHHTGLQPVRVRRVQDEVRNRSVHL